MTAMQVFRRRQRSDDARLPVQDIKPDVVIIREHRAVVEFARTLSTIFNPFLSATVLFVIVARAFSTSVRQFWELSFAGLLFFAVAPVLCIFYLYLSGRISDFDMSDRMERRRAMLAFVVTYLAAAAFLGWVHAPKQLIAVTWGYVGAAAAIMVITRWWKISTHAFGITGPFAALFLLFNLQPLPYVIVVPLVWWARIYLRSHTFAQVFAGAAVAVISTWLFFRLFHLA